MGLLNLRINEIISFLHDNGPNQLDDLRKKYPQYEEFLKLGIILDVEEKIPTQEEVKFKLVVAKILQKTVKLNINKQLRKINQSFLKCIDKRRSIYKTIRLLNWTSSKKRKTLLVLVQQEITKHDQIMKYLDIDMQAFHSLQGIEDLGYSFSIEKAQDIIVRSNRLARSLNEIIEKNKTNKS